MTIFPRSLSQKRKFKIMKKMTHSKAIALAQDYIKNTAPSEFHVALKVLIGEEATEKEVSKIIWNSCESVLGMDTIYLKPYKAVETLRREFRIMKK